MAIQQTAATRRVSKVPAVTKALTILEYLAHSQEAVGAVPLARKLDIVPSTCLHILRALDDEGLVMANPKTKQYSIGAGILSLARAYGRHNPLIQSTRDELDALAAKYSCSLYTTEQLGSDQMIVTSNAESERELSVSVPVGSKFPLLVSAAGLCYAAFGNLSDDDLSREFSATSWAASRDFAAWRADLARVRESGFAVDAGYYIAGSIVMSVPVLARDGAMIGCISAVGIKCHMDDAEIDAVIHDLKRIAARVSSGDSEG